MTRTGSSETPKDASASVVARQEALGLDQLARSDGVADLLELGQALPPGRRADTITPT